VAAATYDVTSLTLGNATVSAGGAAVANGLTASALANDAFLSTSLSLETSRAINVETSLESLIRSERIKFTSILSSADQETYSVSESSFLSGNPNCPGYKAFNGIKSRSDTIDFGWHGRTESYDRYTGTCNLFSTDYLSLNNVYSTANGEWVQIRNTNSFPLLSGVKLYQNDIIYGITSRTIENILILGSKNGTTFREIHSSAVTFTSAEYNLATVLFNSTTTYDYLRLIITKIRGGGTTNDYITIGEIEYLTRDNNITTLQSSLSLETSRAIAVENSLSSSILNNSGYFMQVFK
jgi:hypothetical protein